MSTRTKIIIQHPATESLGQTTGPVTPEGKGRFAELTEDLLTQLAPRSRIEEVLEREIISASWRLERGAQIEANSSLDDSPLDSPENIAMDRARNSAFRILQRALAELRNLQTIRNTREVVLDIPDSESSTGSRRTSR